MSEPNNAVFLSYSSQDAAAAQRICEALRAGGIEVWFDQSELRGGDAWDQKIRRQIRECALFVPIISANTAARHEGYFRLEWNLADERTQKIARNKAFIVPVCLDATSDSGSDVPDSFSRVQWTRLPAGDTTCNVRQEGRRAALDLASSFTGAIFRSSRVAGGHQIRGAALASLATNRCARRDCGRRVGLSHAG
jgi:hypothetical protein